MARKASQPGLFIEDGREDLDKPADSEMQVLEGFPRAQLQLVVGGEVVSELGLLQFDQQIASATVRMGGIAGLHTDEAHRLKGYARRLMISAMRWMRRRGFDTTMLYGIRNFYKRFGYAPAFPSPSFTVAVRDAEMLAAGPFTVVGYRPEYLKAAIRVYDKTNAGRTGPTRRDPTYWQPWRRGAEYHSKAVCKVLLDRAGSVVGYFVYSDDYLSPTVIEVGYASVEVFASILRAAARIAWNQRLENVRLVLPEDEPFVEFCKPLGLQKEVSYRSDGGAMIRMINIPAALRKVAPVLACRMTGSGRLNIHTNLDSVGVRWSRGTLAVGRPLQAAQRVRVPQWALAEMLYGNRDASSLAAAGALAASKKAVAVLDEMFPQRPHFHYLTDKF